MKGKWGGFKHFLRTNIQGFSLAGAISAGGLMGGLTLVLAELSKQQVKMEKRNESNLEINALSDQIRRILNDGDACRNTFNGLTITTTTLIGTLTEIKNKADKVVFEVGKTYGNGLVSLVSMSLNDFAHNVASAEFNVKITLKKTSGAITGYKQTVRNFPISVELDGSNQVVRCHATLQDTIDLSKKQLCTFLGGTPSGSNCDATDNQCPAGQYATSFQANGGPVCEPLGENPHSPEDRNCFLKTTYRAFPGAPKHEGWLKFALDTSNPNIHNSSVLNKWNFCANTCRCCTTVRAEGLEVCESDCPTCPGVIPDGSRPDLAHLCTPCTMDSSCSSCPASGNLCPTVCDGGACPPCSTCPSKSINTFTPKGCPTGYTHRFISPGDANKDAPDSTKASSKFVMEHYCCREVPSP